MLEKPLVISEFPKSGGSWIVSMLADCLGVAGRDIYMRPGFSLFDWRKHPWYVNSKELDFPEQSVIKSHELPDSLAFDFDATQVHLVRDGRDVIVSKFFFDTEFCVKNGIFEESRVNFDDYVRQTACEWARYVEAWSREEKVITVRYEDFLCEPAQTLAALLLRLYGWAPPLATLTETVAKFTKERFSASLSDAFKHNTFVRKGVSGDWVNYFSKENCDAYKAAAGSAHRLLGYSL